MLFHFLLFVVYCLSIRMCFKQFNKNFSPWFRPWNEIDFNNKLDYYINLSRHSYLVSLFSFNVYLCFSKHFFEQSHQSSATLWYALYIDKKKRFFFFFRLFVCLFVSAFVRVCFYLYSKKNNITTKFSILFNSNRSVVILSAKSVYIVRENVFH